ncbi:MAG TPA: hypothetical protein VFF67_10705 [Thermoplasmata archaeon]|nr:hypothetical protein [Thermoplasmata archaeon]
MSRRLRDSIGSYRIAATVLALTGVLATVGASATHPSPRTYLAPYKGTVSSPGVSTGAQACAKAVQTIPKWSPQLGIMNESDSASAKVCAKSLGGVGYFSSAYSSGQLALAIPIRIPTNGSHTIEINWTLTLATIQSWTVGGCPRANFSFPVPSSSSEDAYCTNQELVDVYITAYLVDLTNSSYNGATYACASDYNSSGWQNSSYCYNYGTPGCSNTTGPFNYSNNYGYNNPGWSAFTWNGMTKFSLWTNGTKMVRTDRWIVELNFYKDSQAAAGAYHVLGAWPGAARALINMGTLGNSAKIDSITVY